MDQFVVKHYFNQKTFDLMYKENFTYLCNIDINWKGKFITIQAFNSTNLLVRACLQKQKGKIMRFIVRSDI